MSRDWLLYLEDMVDCTAKVIRFTAGISSEEFAANDLIRDAVLHNLLLLGEAAKHVPDDVRSRYDQIEWRKIAGLRDVLAHAYFGLEPETLWDVVHNKVPPLHEQLRDILSTL